MIGGGITGVMTAYYLAKAGKKVVLIEGERLGLGETGFTTAFLSSVIDEPLTKLRKRFGDKKAAMAWQAGQAAIDEFARLVQVENIACDFTRCPVRIYAAGEQDVQGLERQISLARRYGFTMSFEKTDQHFPWGYAELADQAKFHPREFLLAIAKKSVELGVKIYENSPVTDFRGKDGLIVGTKEGSVTAREIVEATHTAIDHPIEVPARLEPYLSYVIEAQVPKGIFAEGIYWDTEDPYHYFRLDPQASFDRLILGGEDVKSSEVKGQTQSYKKLEEYLRWLTKGVPITINRRWSGQILESTDGLPFIGRSLTNVHHLIATGYAGNGMTFGLAAGQVITDIIIGRDNPFIELFSLTRFKAMPNVFAQAWNFVSHFVGDRLAPRNNEIAAIAPDSGAVVVRNGKKVAVSKDTDGSVKMVSGVCTHLGCVVGWNSTDKTWDCPCHGSKFARDGKVLNGPATKPLEEIK